MQAADRALQRLPKPAGVAAWHVGPPRSPKKKYTAHVQFHDGSTATVQFGAAGMSDYTLHHDEERRRRFYSRFRSLIARKGNDPRSPMFYSAHLLW